MPEPRDLPPIRQFVVDAFTDRPFAGNPAAVVLLDDARPDGWLQALAAENNLSETAYLVPDGDRWSLRWFTPTIEVDLCGHATLASAHVLFEEEGITDDVLRFATRSGELVAEQGADGWIEIDLPADPPEPIDPPAGLIEALGLTAADVVRVVEGRTELRAVEVVSADVVRACRPHFAALAPVSAHGIIVTARGDDAIAKEVGQPVDVVSRFFAPAIGIDEDPVTGAAHCVLAPHWAAELGRTDLLAVQIAARQGVVRVALRGDRVRLGGQAVTVARATLSAATPLP